MADREYFSLVYAVPGFCLILITVGLNFLPIFNILKESGVEQSFALILAFLSFFSGSAIGFLLAQIWFAWFHWRRLYSSRVFQHLEESLKTSLGWKGKEKKGKEKDIALSAVLDYLVLDIKNEAIWKYFQRKWDIFHALSCTLVSLIFAVILGFILRSAHFVLEHKGANPLDPITQFYTLIPLERVDVFLFIFTIISSVAFVVVIWRLRGQIFNEYFGVLKIFIANAKEKDSGLTKRLNNIFPGFFGEITETAPQQK